MCPCHSLSSVLMLRAKSDTGADCLLWPLLSLIVGYLYGYQSLKRLRFDGDAGGLLENGQTHGLGCERCMLFTNSSHDKLP